MHKIRGGIRGQKMCSHRERKEDIHMKKNWVWEGIAVWVVVAATTSPLSAQLVVGSDSGTNGQLWVIDLINPTNTRSLVGTAQTDFQVNGVTADNITNTLYWIDTALSPVNSRLLSAPMVTTGTITPTFIASANIGGVNIGLGALAFDSVANMLVGYKYDAVTGVEGFYSVDTTTGACTLLSEVTDTASYDFFGLDYDATTDAFYATNDVTATQGLYRINKPWTTPPTITFISAYPATPVDSDIDGLAVGNGRLYLINDNNTPPTGGGHYVYNLGTNSYEPHIQFTWPSAGANSGGAWAPGLVPPPPSGANLGISIVGPANCASSVGGTAAYTLTAQNFGPDPADNVEIVVTFPANVSFVSSTPSGTPVGNTLTVNFGTLAAGTSGVLSADFTVDSGTTVDLSAVVNSTTTDFFLPNNSASNSATVNAALPTNVPIKGVLSTIATSDTSLVPDLGGARFAGGAAATLSLLRPWRSPDGTKWIMDADTDIANTAQDEVAVVGTVADGQFSLVLQEGVTAIAEGEHIGVIDDVMGINNAGQYSFSTDTDAAATADKVVVKWDGSAFVVVAREGNPALLGGGINYGTTNNSATIQSDGTVSFYSNLASGGVTTANDTAYFTDDGATLLTREGVTVPTNQGGGTTFTCEVLSIGSTEGLGLMLNADGTSFCSVMEIITAPVASDRFVMVGNDVKVQEGFVIPGSSFSSIVASGSPLANSMEPNGDWYSYGGNADGEDWVVRNGTVIASTDDEIAAGSGLFWDDSVTTGTFLMAAGSPTGQYVVGGAITGDGVTTDTDSVLVLNGTTIIARENDPIDLNDDNAFDVVEDYYIQAFIADRIFVTDSWVYVVVRLRNADDARCPLTTPNVDRGQALIRIPIATAPPIVPGDVNCDGLVNGVDVQAFVVAVLDSTGYPTAYPGCNILNADTNSSGAANDADVASFINMLVGP